MPVKTLNVPQGLLYREASMTMDGEGDEKQLRISISSTEPCLRYDWWEDEEYYEVLDHGPGGMDEERLRAGLPFIFNHDRMQPLGRATSFANNGQKCTISDIIWCAGQFAADRKKDAESGALPFTSVGYEVAPEGECIGARDGIPIYSFKFNPLEGSMAVIPADVSVGVGRSIGFSRDLPRDLRERMRAETPRKISVRTKENVDLSGRKEKKPIKSMAETVEAPVEKKAAEVKVDIVAERAAGRKAYREACEKIDAWAGAIKQPQWKAAALEVATKHKANDEPDYGAFLDEARSKFEGVVALTQEQANPNVGLDRNSIRRFSMAKAMREMSGPKGLDGLTGLEREVCDFSAKAYENKDGRRFEGACIPSDITDARADETFELNARGMENLAWEVRRLQAIQARTMNASTFASGGFLVGTDLLAGSFIDYLRNACFIGQGVFSIIELGGLVGNVAIPKQTSTAAVYWLPEGGSSTASDFAGSQLYGTPHRLSCQGSWTKQLLLQSTPSVEMLVRNDQARTVAVEEDRVVFLGSGASGEPIGIVNTTGVDASVTFSGNWTQAKSLAFQYAIENANANTIGEMVFVTGPLSKSYAMGTVQVASSTFPIYIWMPSKGEYVTINGAKGGIVLDYGAYATKQLSTRVLFGIFNNNVTKFRWGGMDLMVEPYTGAATETIKSYLNEWLDIGVRYPQAFSYSTDAPTSP